jgi:general secretion pathway protein F
LKRQGLTPVQVGTQPAGGWRLPSLEAVSGRDVRLFTQEMATLLVSGIPADRALEIAAELTERPSLRAVVLDVLRVLKGGRQMAEALAAHPTVFSELYVNMVRAGEASGSLAPVFERLAEYERTREDLQSYIVSAMVYPVLLAGVGISSILVLLYFVVPRFAGMFDDGRTQVPLPTQMMLQLSAVTREYGGWLLGSLALLGGVAAIWVRTPEGRAAWHDLQLRLPVFGDIVRKAQTARLARAMGTLLKNGVPLVEALSIAARILTSLPLKRALDAVAQGVKRGEGLAGPLKRAGSFPPLAAHLATVGEETGRLDSMFDRMADIYDADTRAAVKRFTSLFEPVLILAMGLIIGALILSMLLAITSINEVGL